MLCEWPSSHAIFKDPHIPTYYLLFPFHPTCICAQMVICSEFVPIIQCRGDAMPFSCVLRVAILLSLNTLLPWWRTTFLTQMMMVTLPCIVQPARARWPWWSTLWDPVDLMWRHGIRLANILPACVMLSAPAVLVQGMKICIKLYKPVDRVQRSLQM